MKNARFSRRAFLSAAGLGVGFLPLLESDLAFGQAAAYPKRLITVTWTNGIVPSSFYPAAGALTGTLPALLSPLEAYKSKMLMFRLASRTTSPFDVKVMVDANQEYNGHQSYPALLTGTWKSGTASNGPSIDTLIAQDLMTKGAHKSPQLNLGARPYSSSTSWKAAGTKNTAVTDPWKIASSLFAGLPTMPGTTAPAPSTGTPRGSSAEALRLRRASVLDFVAQDLNRFAGKLGTEDRAKVQNHLEAIRELEGKLAATTPTTTGGSTAPAGSGCAQPKLPSKPGSLNSNPDYPALVDAVFGVAGAAAKCDLARTITIDLIDDGGGNSLTFPWLNMSSPDYHAIAHLGASGYPNKTKIDTWFFERLAGLVKDLASAPEGSGTVLDNTCILVCNDMNEGSNHWVKGIPYFIIGSCGGFFKQGQVLSFPSAVPNNQLLTTVCHAMGLQVATVGANYSGDLDSQLKA